MNARIDLAIATCLTDDSIDPTAESDPGAERPTGFLRHLSDLVAPWSAFHLNTCRAHHGPDHT
ncbi:hypothetical protein ABT324_01110 [Saccharopolyspora sp. NPDC000359]|uniref:hypothetical protein n=1 Tax=Saccharopolyspora sp. NPDC000359 TaxID=3154251 RepID=UPI00332FD3ED